MKKVFTLMASALVSLTTTALAVQTPEYGSKQVVNADFDNEATPFANGTVIALQCLDTNGGAGYYFNGAAAKSEDFSAENLYRVVSAGERFKLQSVLNENQFVGPKSAGSNATVVMVLSEEAETFVASVAEPTGWTTKPDDVKSGTNTIRFTASSGLFLNTNNADLTPKYFGGTGGYSAWYVYTFSEDAVAKVLEDWKKDQEKWEKWAETVMTSNKLYTIVSSDGRGALINVDGTLTTTGAGGTADSEDSNHLWGFINVDDKYYLYNYGAEKFASAYTLRVGGAGTAKYVWTLSDIPTAICLTTEAFGTQQAGKYNKFTIEGGRNDKNPAGMMIINNNPQRIPCSLGEGSITDGTGFILTEVETPAIGELMKEKVNDDLFTNEITRISQYIWENDKEGLLVGHYTEEAAAAFNDAINKAKDTPNKEVALYDILEARVTFEGAEKRQVDAGHVYSIVDSDGNVYYTDNTGTELKVGEFTDTEVAYSYWVADVNENGAVSFSHTHEGSDEDAPVVAREADKVVTLTFAINEVSAFIVQPTEELGKVRLVNAENNEPVNDKTYTISFVDEDSSVATTEITEITADGAGNELMYDLQGRKLVAPVKGINIVNGKKVLVK